jgi:16S rRNA processing protein RimM
VTGVSVARIVRPQGRRGEVAASILTDFPERLVKLEQAFLWDGASEPRPVAIRACWLKPAGQMAVFHFAGIDSADQAERLVGLDVQIPVGDRMPLPPGSFYISDLIGCDVLETATDRTLGCVRDVQITGEVPGTSLLVVDTPQGELLIPLAGEICPEIDTAGRRIVVRLPEGLEALNRE